MEQVYLLSLGCAKNQVDSELMRGVLAAEGYRLTERPELAEIIIINTCGFIEAAKKESIEAILELAACKQQGCCRQLVVVGCMAEKYADEMREAMPEIDLIMGSKSYGQIGTLLRGAAPVAVPREDYSRRALVPGAATAYLKIAEGCNNHCSYCLIPQLRGPYVSRPLAEIVKEAEQLAAAGVRELVLIAQDTTKYGLDLPGAPRLAELLEALAALPFAMIRLLYAYPDTLRDDVLAVMAEHDNICHYLDLPVQHGADRILRAMNRHTTGQEILDTLARIRHYLPDAALRSTVMVGFPGESEEDFHRLLAFLREARFDWVGAFPYSQEADTPAALMAGQITEEVKQQRYHAVMQLAAEITAERLRRFIGQTMPVLAEGVAEGQAEGWYQGRSQYQAPEVDGLIYFRSDREIQPGKIYLVRITGSDIYDLMGEI